MERYRVSLKQPFDAMHRAENRAGFVPAERFLHHAGEGAIDDGGAPARLADKQFSRTCLHGVVSPLLKGRAIPHGSIFLLPSEAEMLRRIIARQAYPGK